MAYRTRLPVRFGDVDRAGIVYFPIIFHYLHVAQEDFFSDYIGTPYHRLIEEERLGFPTVSDSTDFLRPLKYGDSMEIVVWISRLGDSSATFEFEVRDSATGEVRARSSQVKVAVDLDTWAKISIPERYRRLLEECGPAES